MSQQGVSADIIQKFLPKNRRNKDKKQQGADRLVTTQIWKLKNLMSLFF
jgi:hypothetical protein